MRDNKPDVLNELHEQREQNREKTRVLSAEQIAANTNKNGMKIAKEFGIKVLKSEQAAAA